MWRNTLTYDPMEDSTFESNSDSNSEKQWIVAGRDKQRRTINQDDPRPSTSRENIELREDFFTTKASENCGCNSDRSAQCLKRKLLATADNRCSRGTEKICRTELDNEEPQTCGIDGENIEITYSDEKSTYAASGLKQSLHGDIYQLKHLMLTLHRAWKSGYPFRLSTEMNAAEKFDDLVLQYRENAGREVHRFVQLKHKQDQSKDIRVGDLLARDDGEFSLQKYFISWRKIRKSPEFSDSVLKNFILCTNIGIDIKGLEKAGIHCSKVTELDEFLKTNRTDQPPSYKLSADGRSELYDKLRVTSDVCKLAMVLALRVHNSKIIDLKTEIFKFYHTALAQEVVDIDSKTFFTDFIQNNSLSKRAVNFREIFVSNMKQLKRDASEAVIRKDLEGRTLKLSSNFGKESKLPGEDMENELPDDVIDDKEILGFLNDFTLAVSQPNEIELGEMITTEIGADSQFNLLHADVVGDSFQKIMLDWFKKKDGEFLSRKKAQAFFDEIECKISSIVAIGVNLAYSEKLKNYNVKFEENGELQKFLSSFDFTGIQIFNIISSKDTLLTALRVYQTIVQMGKDRKDDSFVFIRLRTLLRTEMMIRVLSAFGSPSTHHLLIIDCGSTITNENSNELWNALCKIMKGNSHKKMIIITRENNSITNRLEIGIRICRERDSHVGFNNLTKCSQQTLLEKQVINFQGREKKTSFRRLLGIPDSGDIGAEYFNDFEEIIDSSTLVKLINDEEIRIGSHPNKLEEIEEYYIPRTISRRVVIDETIFGTQDMPDLIAISGLHETKYSTKNGSQLEKFHILDNDREMDQFKILCEQNTGCNIHWLHFESGILIWKQSVGEISNLVDYRVTNNSDNNDYATVIGSNRNSLLLSKIGNHPHDKNYKNSPHELIDHQLIAHNENRKIAIISDQAGMGKTTVMTHLANKLKGNESCLLVVMIELTHFTTVLAEERRNPSLKHTDTNGVVNFFVEKFLNFETNLEVAVAKRMISKHGQAVLFFDGFDEISPNYEDTVIDLLQTFAKLPIEKLFVTTRPHTRKVLEQKLNTFSYTLEQFSATNQIEFLTKFWRKELNLNRNNELIEKRLEQYAQAVMKMLADLISDCRNELTGVPLQTRLVAEVFGVNGNEDQGNFQVCEDFIYSVDNEPKLPKKINLIYLYRNFINQKYDIYRREKKKDDLTNLGVEEDSEDLREIFLRIHQQFALCTLFKEKALRELLSSRQKTCFAALIRKNKGRVLRTGIVTQIINDIPHFIHRTFAEYFTAIFLINTLNDDDRNKNVRRFFVAEILHKPEHRIIRAFLNYLLLGESTSLEDDSWKSIIMTEGHGRQNVFYVAAAEGNEQIIRFFLNCLREHPKDRKTLVNMKDGIGQTAVLMAARNGHWEELKVLVEYGDAEVNCSTTLEQAPLHAAAVSGNIDMLKYLLKMGANPHLREKYGEPEGKTLLHQAAAANSLEIVKCFVEGGADVNAQDWQAFTPLHEALVPTHSIHRAAIIHSSGNDSKLRDIVQYLLEKGADANHRDKNGYTPLFLATELVDDLEILDCLLKSGANVNSQVQNGQAPLHVAVRRRKLHLVKYLLEKGATPDCQGIYGSTPLHCAVSSDYSEIVECLVDRGANINCRDIDGDTPLLLAVGSGNCNVIKYLLKKGAIVDCQDNYGWTPLSVAIIRASKLDVVECLVEGHAKVNFQNDFGETALHTATSASQVDIMKYLIEKGGDVHHRDHNGRTPLHEACSAGNQYVKRYLLAHVLAVDSENEYDWSDPHDATLANRLDVVKCLLEEAANSQDENHWTPCHDIISHSNWYVMKHLYEKKAEIGDHKKYRWMTLSEANLARNSEMVTFFIEGGADFHSIIQDQDRRSSLYALISPCNFHFVNKMYEIRARDSANCQDKYHWTEPFEAALAIKLDVVKYLVEKNADVNCQDEDGETPLHGAIAAGNLDVVQYLLEMRADVDCPDEYGWTPLHEATNSNNFDIVTYLVERGANVNCEDEDGETPLHIAISTGNLDMVKYLVAGGANVDIRDKNLRTPLENAISAGNSEVVTYLLEN